MDQCRLLCTMEHITVVNYSAPNRRALICTTLHNTAMHSFALRSYTAVPCLAFLCREVHNGISFSQEGEPVCFALLAD